MLWLYAHLLGMGFGTAEVATSAPGAGYTVRGRVPDYTAPYGIPDYTAPAGAADYTAPADEP